MSCVLKCVLHCYDFGQNYLTPRAMKWALIDKITSLSDLIHDPVKFIASFKWKNDEKQGHSFFVDTVASYLTAHVIVVLSAAAIAAYTTHIPLLAVTAAMISLYAAVDTVHVAKAARYTAKGGIYGSAQYTFFTQLGNLRPARRGFW